MTAKREKLRLTYYDPRRVELPAALMKRIKLRRLGRLAGYVVWAVDGAIVRSHVDVDFALGGNPARYSYVPEGEIWVEWTGSMDDVKAIALHEVNEAACMQAGASYDDAHESASRGERRVRRGEAPLPVFTANPAFPSLRVFHGTSSDALPAIRSAGLTSELGYRAPGWYMVAEDFASAAYHAQHVEGAHGVVVELLVPTEGKLRKGRRVKMWDGFPYLWKPSMLSWEGKPTRWWALRQPLPSEFIVSVHPVDAAVPNPDAPTLTVCSWCRDVIFDGPVGPQGEVSHGLCYACAVEHAEEFGLTDEDLEEMREAQEVVKKNPADEAVFGRAGHILRPGEFEFNFGWYGALLVVDVHDDVQHTRAREDPRGVSIAAYLDRETYESSEIEADLDVQALFERAAGEALGTPVAVFGPWYEIQARGDFHGLMTTTLRPVGRFRAAVPK